MSNVAVRLVSVLLVVSAAAFAVGVAIERSQHHETTAATPVVEGAATSGETGSETGEGSSTSGESAAHTSETHTESGEKLLGISAESTGLVALAVVASLLLAFLLWVRGAATLLVTAALLVGVVFAAFDVREALHQADLSNSGLLTIGIVVAALHAAVAVLAARLLVRGRSRVRAAG